MKSLRKNQPKVKRLISPAVHRMALFAVQTMADLRGALIAIEHLDPDSFHDADLGLAELKALISHAGPAVRNRLHGDIVDRAARLQIGGAS